MVAKYKDTVPQNLKLKHFQRTNAEVVVNLLKYDVIANETEVRMKISAPTLYFLCLEFSSSNLTISNIS